MSMQHSYATGATLGTRSIYDVVGGTDSLEVSINNSAGTYTVVSDSSTYGDEALQIVTSASASDMCAARMLSPSGQTERRVSVIMDMPTLLSGQFIAPVNEGNDGGNFYIYMYQNGSWAVACNGSTVYTSSAGVLPAAGTTIRIAYALAINGSSSTWRANIYDDASETPVSAEQTGTTAWSGTFWGYGYAGKTLGQSATSTTVLIRAVRVENGGGCGLALLPGESALMPSEGSDIVPIRFVSYSGTAPSPSGVSAITNLSDGDNGTTVTVTTGASIRVALRPMNIVGPYLTFNLYQLALTSAGDISVKLWKGSDGTQIGATKTVSVETSATDGTVTFDASELSGLTTADWEALELEILVP